MDVRHNRSPAAAAFLDVRLRVRAVFHQDFYQVSGGRTQPIAWPIMLSLCINARSGNRKKQGRDADVRGGVDIRFVAQKQLDQVGVVIQDGPMQR